MARRRFVKVIEAAEILGIGRTAAYEGVKRYRETDGAEGIAVVAVGGSLRVPVAWLETMAGGPIDVEDVEPPKLELVPDHHPAAAPAATRAPRRSTSHRAQHQLPFTD